VILHPGILSLLVGSVIVILMLLYSSSTGLIIVRKWDITSSSDEQLSLERKTYLISTIMNYVLGFEILSAFVFIYTADDIHTNFVGAMCATGSLNANPIGWWVLHTKILVLFLSAIWIALNVVDQRAEDYPLVKLKYQLLLFMLPLVAIETYFQFRYFLGLKPNVITSCCGALFSESGGGLASGLSSLPILPTMISFYGTIGLYVLLSLLFLLFRRHSVLYLSSLLAVVVLGVSLASIVSFISLYFYEIPTHHCPFDILQDHYHHVGYPLYGALFGGTFFGLVGGIAEPLRKIESVRGIIDRLQVTWVTLSLILIIVFVLISTWPIVFSSFTLEGYY
jgi:hypothetical protein